ncbi:hypothetical protein SVAN01_03183 [Stagonosporopsis vannaccii]|nr:hypothetical protein SVAN01_03183 [Stagonosporopsis vannaccii]
MKRVTGIILASGNLLCPGVVCSGLQFDRLADWRRHYANVHVHSAEVDFFCPVTGCNRSRNPGNRTKGRSFKGRRDKMEEHVQIVHQNWSKVRARSSKTSPGHGKDTTKSAQSETGESWLIPRLSRPSTPLRDVESEHIIGHILESEEIQCADLACDSLLFNCDSDLLHHRYMFHPNNHRSCPVEDCDRSGRPKTSGEGRIFGSGFCKNRTEDSFHFDPETNTQCLSRGEDMGSYDKEQSLWTPEGEVACAKVAALTTDQGNSSQSCKRNSDGEPSEIDPKLNNKSPAGFSHPTINNTCYYDRTASLESHCETDSTQSDSTDEFQNSDRAENIEDYLNALEYFGLCSQIIDSQESNSQQSASSNNRNNDNHDAALSRSNSMNAPGILKQKDVQSGDSPEGTRVAVETKDSPEANYRPLELLCWHAANGIRCKRHRYSSTKTRHLYK